MKEAEHQNRRIDLSLGSDVRPFGDSLGLVQTTDPLLGTSVLCTLCQKLLASLNRKAPLFLASRYDRSIFTGFSHFGHLSSITPVVGVILSRTRQPQFGHFFDTRMSFRFSANIIISHYNIQNFVRVPQMLFAKEAEPHHPDAQSLFGHPEQIAHIAEAKYEASWVDEAEGLSALLDDDW